MTNKNQIYMKTLGLIALIGIIISQSNISSLETLDIQHTINMGTNILNFPVVSGDHDPILINGNAELASFISNESLSGDGTYNSPYIIEDFIIDASYDHGIYIKNTDAYLTIQNCKIEAKNFSLGDGLLFSNSKNVIIKNNIFTNFSKGIALFDTTATTLSENNIFNNTIGIHILSSSNNTIFGNNINCNGETQNNGGIALYKSGFNTISDNNITNNIFGIQLDYNCYNNTFSRNNINHNKLWGIGSNFDCNNNTIFENNVTNNYRGIELNYTSNNNIIFGNIVSFNNESGIKLWESSFNIIFGNNVSFNDENGIILDYRSKNNTIYFNDFYENQGFQAYENKYCTGNQWDNGTAGNYWGDYSDKYPDVTNDGTYWNTPYEIYGDDGGIDYFPLVTTILDYKAPEEKKISGFPIVSMLFFISVGVFLLRRKIRN